MTAPFPQGQQAAKEGQPHTACPYPKPNLPEQGDKYPGNWADWMSGWRTQRGWMKLDYDEARAELDAFIQAGLKVPVRTRKGTT